MLIDSLDEGSGPSCSAHGLTRRGFLAGLGLTGIAAVGGQLLTTRVAFGAEAAPAGNTAVVVFLRGGADGLRILVPNAPSLGLAYLSSVRNALVPRDGALIPLDGGGGWAVHAAMRPLYDALWATGELAFVPAVSATGVTRSHFQAERYLEAGGSDTAPTGWLDRVLEQMGPGTSFRALSQGSRAPISMAGDQPKLAISSLADFTLVGAEEMRRRRQTALGALYAGTPGLLGEDVPATLASLATAEALRARASATKAAAYPVGPLGHALGDLATILRAEVGLRVATVDVGGWDTHTNEAPRLDKQLTEVAAALAAFMTDLGPERRKRVTVVVQTEFGRRVEMNGSGGADHGTGGLTWLLGGGVAGKAVHGKWRPLMSKDDLENGDVPGLNNTFDILGEVVQKRLGIGSLTEIFPGHEFNPLGVARTT